jgi:hypothetical protein
MLISIKYILYKLKKKLSKEYYDLLWYCYFREYKVIHKYRERELNILEWARMCHNDLLKFKNKHKGEDCFILGNGPSLAKLDLSLLKNKYVFGLNKIHLMFELQPELELDYHVSVNPLVLEQTKNQLLNNVYNSFSFIPFSIGKELNLINTRNIKFINTTGAPYKFNDNITKPINEGWTVSFVALQVAYYMGFQNIYLIGMDNNFIQQGSPNEQQLLSGEDPNHFHPDYFKDSQWHLADVDANNRSFGMAEAFFKSKGRSIYNATVGGKLEVFRRIEFSKAVAISKSKAVK